MTLTADQTARFNVLFKSGVPYRTALVLANRPTDDDLAVLLAALPSGGGGGGGTGTVTAVNGKSPVAGVVTLVKGDLGLGNVDNTADTAKPVSTAATTALAAKADAAATTASLAAKADLVGGKVPNSQLPSIALVTTVPVANQAAMLALTAAQVQPGDVAVVAADPGRGSWVLGVGGATDPSVLANWQLLTAPTDVVSTVAGRTGTVTLAKADVGLANVDNTADVNKPVSTAQAAADTAATNAATALSMLRASNGSDIASPSAFRTALGLGTAALAAATSFAPTPGRGLLSARPAATGSHVRYVATDVAGGTEYEDTAAGVWSQVNSGLAVKGAELAVVTSASDLPFTVADTNWHVASTMGMVIPAGSPFRLRLDYIANFPRGTAGAGAHPTMQVRVIEIGSDGSSPLMFDITQVTLIGLAGEQWQIPVCHETPTHAAYAVDTTVELDLKCGSVDAGIGALAMSAFFGLRPIRLAAIAA